MALSDLMTHGFLLRIAKHIIRDHGQCVCVCVCVCVCEPFVCVCVFVFVFVCMHTYRHHNNYSSMATFVHGK